LNISVKKIIKPLSVLSFVGLSVWLCNVTFNTAVETKKQSYIISAKSYSLLQDELAALQVKPTHKLAIINAVAVSLNDQQLAQLENNLSVQVTPNHSVELSSGKAWGKRKWQPKSVVNNLIDASSVHASRNFGDGVTIGFLDTGLDQLSGLSTDLYGRDKAWGTYDAVNNTISNYDDEASGHGTHVASIAANSDYDVYGRVYGVAPNAAIVGIKAFDAEGKATYADVIRGIDWAIQVKDQINLKILNMSFSGPVRSFYWEDPLNKAVMKAWQAGIVVIASAGNRGPEPMTIGVPGNIPYIITVGAMTDNYTDDKSDDKLATFSSAGPTIEGFVKPEIVAPGGHLSGLMSYDTQIVMEHPEFHDGGRYFEMSGTSQATAVVSGVVALMLTQDPSLSPDDIKCRLMDSAKTATNSNGGLAFSVFQQGAGMVNALGAIMSTAQDCANQNIDIAQEVNEEQHFYGPANIDDQGNFYIEGMGDEYKWNRNEELNGDGFIWTNTLGTDGFIWTNYLGTDGFIWTNTVGTDGFIWTNKFATDGFIWTNNLDTDGFIWTNSVDFFSHDTINVNNWVDQQ
jgi:serine protease AprX